MRALGINQKKETIKQLMTKVDKDGSGAIDQHEFLALMAEQIELRNQEEELRKVFSIYDADDKNVITFENLMRCANELRGDVGDVSEEQIGQMIEMADRRNEGELDIEDFIALMTQIGLITEKQQSEGDADLAAEKAAFE